MENLEWEFEIIMHFKNKKKILRRIAGLNNTFLHLVRPFK
jgi:hypothetical protein